MEQNFYPNLSVIYAISLLLMKNYSGKAAKVQTLLTTDLHLCYSKYPKKRLLTIKQGLLKIEKIIILLSIWFPKKNCSTDFCPTYFNGKILKEFDKSMKTRTILIDLKITLTRLTVKYYCKNYMLLVSRNILLIISSPFSPTDLFSG